LARDEWPRPPAIWGAGRGCRGLGGGVSAETERMAETARAAKLAAER
jgi:hypothetical protein